MANALSHRLAVLAVCTFCASDAMASHFEFCWLTGSVEALGERTDVDQYFELRVSSSEPARNGSLESYDPEDCSQYSGTVIKANLPVSMEISVGAKLELIQRLWVDVNGQWWNAWQPTDGWELHD